MRSRWQFQFSRDYDGDVLSGHLNFWVAKTIDDNCVLKKYIRQFWIVRSFISVSIIWLLFAHSKNRLKSVSLKCFVLFVIPFLVSLHGRINADSNYTAAYSLCTQLCFLNCQAISLCFPIHVCILSNLHFKNVWIVLDFFSISSPIYRSIWRRQI